MTCLFPYDSYFCEPPKCQKCQQNKKKTTPFADDYDIFATCTCRIVR